MLDKYSIVCSPRIVEVPPTRRRTARPPSSIHVPTSTVTVNHHNDKVSIHALRNESRSLVDKGREKRGSVKGRTTGAVDGDSATTSLSECTTLDETDKDDGEGSHTSSEGSTRSSARGDEVDNGDADSLSEYLNELLMDLWTAHMDDDEQQITRAFHQLALECGPQRGWPQTRRCVLYAGGHSQIVHILSEHKASNSICRAALGAVMALCVSHSARALVGTSAAGIETLVAVMRQHPHDAFLQTTACGILVQLVSPPSSERDRYTRPTSRRRDDDEATADRQAEAAAALSKAAIVAAGGIPVVLDAMKELAPKSPRLCRYACLLLVGMANNNAYHRERLLSEGAVPVVAGLVRAYRPAHCEAFLQANALLRVFENVVSSDSSKSGNSSSSSSSEAYGSSSYFYEI